MLYTHMFYQPDLLAKFMPAYASRRLITILRAPLDVLKSAQKMALVQRNSQKERHLNNSFCQPLAHNTELWLARCPMANAGDGSILEYLDIRAHFKLKAMLQEARRVSSVNGDNGIAAPLAQKVVAEVLSRPLHRLEHAFVVGMQADFDLSLLLFQEALGLGREDILYSKTSMVSHDLHKSKWAQMVDDDWNGALRRKQISDFLERRGSPIRYHNMLFEKGLEVYNRQVKLYLGDGKQVASALAAFKAQLTSFTTCYERQRSQTRFRTCSSEGLALANRARFACTKDIRSVERRATRIEQQ